MALNIIYVISFIIVCAAGNPTGRTTNNLSTNSSESTVISNNTNVSPDANQKIPTTFIIGKSNGEMLRCLYDNPNSCIVFNKAGSAIASTVVSGEYIYAGLSSGTMWQCDLYKKDSCIDFNTAGSAINALAVAGSYIYAGLHSGTILRCKLSQAGGCSTYYDAGVSATALAASEDHVFVGLESGKMLRCSTKEVSNCDLLNTAASAITALAVMGDTVFAGTSNGTMWRCSSSVSDSCLDWNKAGKAVTSLSIFNRKIFVVLNSGLLWSCELDKAGACWDLTQISEATSVSNVYGYITLLTKFRNEHVSCSWQKKLKCPPFVVHYDSQDRLMFELRVINGKVYNSQGVLFDTSNAYKSHSGIAAIFVMEPNGRILVSNTHIKFLIHHSSLVAGNPVAAAGEINIKEGVITDMTTCSGHYHPTLTLDKQVLQSLFIQGYTGKIDIKECLVEIY